MYGPISAFESYILGALRFDGRASRSEYWWPNSIVFGLVVLAGLIDARTVATAITSTGQIPTGALAYWSPIVCLLTFVPTLSSMVRRLHDSGRSGWWILIQCIPLIGPLVLLGLLVAPSKPRINGWGAPRDAGQAAAVPAGARQRNAGHSASALDSYAVLLQANAEPNPDEVARRKQEVHEYFVRNVSRRGAA